MRIAVLLFLACGAAREAPDVDAGAEAPRADAASDTRVEVGVVDHGRAYGLGLVAVQAGALLQFTRDSYTTRVNFLDADGASGELCEGILGTGSALAARETALVTTAEYQACKSKESCGPAPTHATLARPGAECAPFASPAETTVVSGKAGYWFLASSADGLSATLVDESGTLRVDTGPLADDPRATLLGATTDPEGHLVVIARDFAPLVITRVSPAGVIFGSGFDIEVGTPVSLQVAATTDAILLYWQTAGGGAEEGHVVLARARRNESAVIAPGFPMDLPAADLSHVYEHHLVATDTMLGVATRTILEGQEEVAPTLDVRAFWPEPVGSRAIGSGWVDGHRWSSDGAGHLVVAWTSTATDSASFADLRVLSLDDTTLVPAVGWDVGGRLVATVPRPPFAEFHVAGARTSGAYAAWTQLDDQKDAETSRAFSLRLP